VYVPRGDALFAFLSLEDPTDRSLDGWVTLENVETQRGLWEGSDAADFRAGLEELIVNGWVESSADQRAFRISPQGHLLKSRVTDA